MYTHNLIGKRNNSADEVSTNRWKHTQSACY